MENNNPTPQEIPTDIKQQIWDAATRHSANIDQDYKEDTERDFYAGAAWAYRRLSSPVGLRWVRASERYPERKGWVHLRQFIAFQISVFVKELMLKTRNGGVGCLNP